MTDTPPAQPILVPLGELIEARSALGEIENKALDPKLAYRISRIAKFIEEEAIFFENLRRTLIKKYGEEVLDEKGQPTGNWEVRPTMPSFKDWVTSIQSVNAEEVTFPFRKISIDEFGGNQLSPLQIAKLSFMLESAEKARESIEDVHLNGRAQRRKALLEQADKIERPPAAPGPGDEEGQIK